MGQVSEAVGAIKDVLGEALVAIYLHGSAAQGGLRPQSDIDLLAIMRSDLTAAQRRGLLMAMLRLSARYPARPGGRRCLELMVFNLPELAEGNYPARAEFVYGEWLRDGFAAGDVPQAARDPEHTLVLAQARRTAITLFGPLVTETLPEIAFSRVQQAMKDTLPVLLQGLRGDERNVLLTLARMWYTATTGEFVPKDAAADWAIARSVAAEARLLDYARRAYLGEVADEWNSRGDAAMRLAAGLRARVAALL